MTPEEIAALLGCDDLRVGEQRRVRAPYRDDPQPSLNVTRRRGTFLFCDFGIEYDEGQTLAALREHFGANGAVPTVRMNARRTRGQAQRGRSSVTRIEDMSPLDWWAEYTQVPRDEWERLGCDEDDTYVLFEFPGVDARKKRRKGTRSYEWEGLENPPLWPLPEDELPPTVGLAEGESDCGVMRSLGYHSFTTTKGAAATGDSGVNADVLRALKERGAEEVFIVSDGDPNGAAFRRAVVASAAAAGLRCAYVDLAPYRDVTRGEKDVRALFLRDGADELVRILEEEAVEIEPPRPFAVAGREFVGKAKEDVDWLIPDLIARGDKVGCVAPAKTLKTYEALALSIAATQHLPVFKNELWTPKRALRILFIEEEGGEIQFAKRMRRVALGLGLKWDEIDLPHVKHSTGFRLDPAQVDDLIDYVLTHEIDLVVADPWVRVLPTGSNENFGGADGQGPAWEQVQRLKIETGAATLILHHVGHAGRFDAITGGRGWSGFGAEIDVGFALERIDADEDGWERLAFDIAGREIEAEGSSGEASVLRYRFDRASDLFETEFTPATVPKVKMVVRRTSKIKPLIEAYLQNVQGAVVLTRDVTEEVNRLLPDPVTDQAVLNQLSALEHERKVAGHENAGSRGAKGWSWVQE